MKGIYLDTSALGRVLLAEPDDAFILHELLRYDVRVASRILQLELRRLGLREGLLENVDQLLAGVALVAIDDAILDAAETIRPSNVATLDAIHLATAVRLATDGMIEAVMTYDKRLGQAAESHGLTVVSPA